jgi:hypothetical protein
MSIVYAKRIAQIVTLSFVLVLSSADQLIAKYTFLNVGLYVVLFGISVAKIDWSEGKRLVLSLLYLAFLLIISLWHYEVFDGILFMKYAILGVVFILPMKGLGGADLIRSSAQLALLFLLAVGLFQFYKVTVLGEFLHEGSIRPVGFSVEPTWYSQQLVVLFIVASTKIGGIRFIKRLKVMLMSLVMLITFTRTSLIVYSIHMLSARAVIVLLILSFVGFNLVGSLENSPLYKGILYKIENTSNYQEEPRFKALVLMQREIRKSFVFGNGLNFYIDSRSGLTVGAKYAILPLAMFYSFGLVGVCLYSVLGIAVISEGNLFKKIGFVSLFFSLFMPYLFSIFALVVLFSLKIYK